MKKGFTLVELSIVLVIIGLLIGGILIGQSLIDSAKVIQQVKNLQAFKVAYDRFRDVYKQKPGDFSNRIATFGGTRNGNNDGSITWDANESAGFWVDLTHSGFLDVEKTAFPPYYYMSYELGKYTSDEAWNNDLTLYYAKTGTLYTNNSAIPSNTDIITMARHSGSLIDGAVLTPAEAFALDKKFDDSMPRTGKLRGHNGRIYDTNTSIACSVLSGTDYIYKGSEPDPACTSLYLIEQY